MEEILTRRMRFISIIFAYNHNFTQNSSPVRFAFLIFKVFPFGGVQRDMLRIAQDCVKNGHQVTIYTGEWRDNCRHGHGTLRETDGLIYEGCFINGVKVDGAWAPQFFDQAIAFELQRVQ